jgi:hypothetical protein
MYDGKKLVGGWDDFVPEYTQMGSSRKQRLRQRLDHEARDEMAMPVDSPLRIAFDRWNCWLAHLRQDWYE